ncbi:MAG TPA: hypothetical protein VMR50_00435, partial [Myxococcota bacterium]|nr:hypothetical protein [Myxococcota bacterium]
MGLSEVVAGQLRKPSGWFGRLVVARLLDRANAPLDELALAKLRASLRDDGRLAVTFNPRSSAERLA